MELRRYLGILRRRLWLVLVLLIVGGILGDLATSQKPVYAATSTIYIGSSNFNLNTAQGVDSGADQQVVATTLIPTYTEMLHSQPIAADAATRAGFALTAGDILADTAVTNETNTTLLDVTAQNINPAVAQAIANGVANAFIAKIRTFQTKDSQGSVPTAPAYIFSQAKLPTSPLPAKTLTDTIKGVLVGLVLGVGLAGLLEYLDVTVKGPADAEDRLELPVLGVIPLRRADA